VQALPAPLKGIVYEGQSFERSGIRQHGGGQKHVARLEQKSPLFSVANLGGQKLWACGPGVQAQPRETCGEASPRTLMEDLLESPGATVQAFDPEAMEETQRIYGDEARLTLCGTNRAGPPLFYFF